VQSHSSLILSDGKSNATADGTYVLLNNNDTVYFYVTGSYNDNGSNTLSVNVITGFNNAINTTNATGADPTIDKNTNGNTNGVGIRQAFYTKMKSGTKITSRASVDAMLIQGVQVENETLYYYNEGNYHVDKVDGGYTLTYVVYLNSTGESVEVTYDNNGSYYASVAKAKDVAKNKSNGFYTLGADDLKVFFDNYSLKSGLTGVDVDLDGIYDIAYDTSKVYYIVDDTAYYDDINDNLFTDSFEIGSISASTTVVDVCNSGLTTVAQIARAIKTNSGNVSLSYSVDTKYKTAVLFVTSYDPDPTQAPNGATKTTYQFLNSLVANSNNGVVTVTGTIYQDNDDAKILSTSVNAGDVKAVYTITATSSAGVVKTYTYTDKTGTISAGVFTGDIPTFRATSGSTWAYDVDVVLTFTYNNATVTVGGSGVII
jgi:hypothetical protein